MKIKKKICIVGSGGFGREVLCCFSDIYPELDNISEMVCFMVDDHYFKSKFLMDVEVIPFSKFNNEEYLLVVAIGDPILRKNMVERFPKNTEFTNIIHPKATISKWVTLSEGTIITAGSILTCNIKIGKHSHINLNSTIGHDCVIGDYFTTAPGVNISGNCKIGNNVYFGTNSSIKEGVSICSDVTIGMGAIVLKNVDEPGVYVGNPLRKLEKNTNTKN
jgi:sugar O-acyltransferase (sialic acid O-acetyltransferase NeuD family)